MYMGFKDLLRKELLETLTEEELKLLPRGFQSLEDVMILKLKEELLPKKEIIAKKAIKVLPKYRSVYINLGKIEGKFRQPDSIEYILGEKNSIVHHKEHGVVYKFDFLEIMFSKGNLHERKYLAELVKESEIIVDMFAGIGYFSLPIAVNAKPAKIYSIELNPLSFKFLKENVQINKVDDTIVPILGNSNEEVVKLSERGVEADRVIMGVFPAPKSFVKSAILLAKKEGTIFHYEGVIEGGSEIELYKEFTKEVDGESYSCQLQSSREVKSYGPNLYHVVLDILVHKKS